MCLFTLYVDLVVGLLVKHQKIDKSYNAYITHQNLLVRDMIQLLEYCIVNNGMKLSLLKQKLLNFKGLEITINRVKNLY